MLRFIIPLLLLACAGHAAAQPEGRPYSEVAQAFLDRLLATASDSQGPVQHAMWASVIHAPSGRVPRPDETVPPTEGVRAHDRAVWGSNLYHDISTIKLGYALSELTGKPVYRTAAETYLRDFLRHTQHPATGLLGWGEHLYYNFYEDVVAVGHGRDSSRTLYHEFLGETPPWTTLWAIDSLRTRRAIEGLRYHFRGFQTQTYLFNRHAYWKVQHPKAEGWEADQFQRDGQPWIKHAGLLSYSFQFLHAQTGDPPWADWARGVGELYWRHRNPETNLVVSCIDDQRPHTRLAQLPGTTQLAYWMYKGGALHPDADWARQQALTLLTAIEARSWDADRAIYRGTFELDGSLVGPEPVPVFITGYGEVSLLTVGQMAAYLARETGDSTLRQMVRRIADQADRATLPQPYVIHSLAEALHFYLDAYELLGDPAYLDQARQYADTGIEDLLVEGLFVRQPDDPYYEAKLGPGRFALGLLRLDLARQGHPLYASIDWSL